MNQDTVSSPLPPPPAAAASDLLAKRKRGRPRKDETSQVHPKPNTDLVGKVVSCMVEGSFDAGYLLNVNVKDSDIKLRGLVFIAGKVNSITPENDVAPLVKMYKKEEIKNQTLRSDQPMKDDDAAVTDLEISDSARDLSLMPQESNGKTAGLVEFFPNPETMMMTQPNLVLLNKETEQKKTRGFDIMAEEKLPETTVMTMAAQQNIETEQQNSPGENTRGFDLTVAEKPVCEEEKVPEMIELELGNKTTLSGDNNIMAMETNGETSVCKSGFIANLFEGQEKKELVEKRGIHCSGTE